MRKKCKKIIKKFCSLVSLTRHFTKFIFLEQLTAMPQFNMQNMLGFFFFFFFFFLSFFFFFCFCFFFFCLSSHYDTNPLRHLYHFREKYNYILANINSESSGVIFSFFFFFFFFFVFIQWVKHFCTPANFVTI